MKTPELFSADALPFNLAAQTVNDEAPALAQRIAREESAATEAAAPALKLNIAGEVNEVSLSYRSLGRDAYATIDSPDSVAALMRPLYAASPEVETVFALCCDVKTRVKLVHKLTVGTATASLLHPREVFRAAILAGAACVIVVHNHPSGDPAPSKADLDMTRRLSDSAKILGITLADHLIVGEPTCDPTGRGRFSFAEAGLL